MALIERHFKLRFVLRLCILVVAGMVGITVLLYLLTSRDLGESYVSAFTIIYDLRAELFQLVFASVYSILILSVVTLAVAVISIFYSHKVAGPLFRIERNLDLVGSGDLTVQTRFRGNDQLLALAEDLNSMTRSLNHLVRSIAGALKEVKAGEDNFRSLAMKEAADHEETRKALAGLKESMRALDRAVGAVKMND